MRLPSSRAHHGSSSAIQMGRVLKNLQHTNKSLLPRKNKALTIQEPVPNVEADAPMASESGPADTESACSSSKQWTTNNVSRMPQWVECPTSNDRSEAGSSHGRRKKLPIVSNEDRKRVYPCVICGKTFASGRALGGHKRCHRVKKAVDEALNGPKRSNNRGRTAAGGTLIFRRKAQAEQGGSSKNTQVTEGIRRLQLDGESTEKAAQLTEEPMQEGPKKPRDFDLNIPYEEKEEE